MDRYTRVKKAITFSGPDRIPLWVPEDPDYSDIDTIFSRRMPLVGTTGGSEVTNNKGEKLRLIGVDGIAVTDNFSKLFGLLPDIYFIINECIITLK